MSQHDSRYSTDVNNKFDIPDVIGENVEQLSWFSAVTHQPSEWNGKIIREFSPGPFIRPHVACVAGFVQN